MISTLLGPPIGYVDLLNHETGLAQTNESQTGKKYHPLRPSSSGKCTRELYYELMEFYGKANYQKEPLSAETVRIFDLGHHVERHLIGQFDKNVKSLDIKYKQQVLTFYKIESKEHPELNHMVEGSLDLCFWSPTSRGVVDFKSKKDRFSAFFKTNWDETDEKLRSMKSVAAVSSSCYWVDDLAKFLDELRDPWFESNFLQLNGYACTEFLRERGVDHGSIIQSNKNDSRLREIRFRPSLELYEKVRLKFQRATDAVAMGDDSLATRDHMLGSSKCAYCPFKQACWPDKDALKEMYANFPKKRWPSDTNRLGEAGSDIEQLMSTYRTHQAGEKAQKALEQDILMAMERAEVEKIRLANGEVYEAKRLKDGMVIRRGKA